MRRLPTRHLFVAAVALLATTARAHAPLEAQAPRDPQDSLALAAGCRLLAGDTPALPTTVHLDSAGIRVTQGWQSAGLRADGLQLACPVPTVAFRFSRGDVAWSPPPIASPGWAQPPGDPPYLRARSDSTIASVRADLSPLWQPTAEEVAGVGHVGPWTGWRTWRDALPVLAAKLHDGTGVTPPPVVPPPVVPPPVTPPPVQPPAADPCAAGVGSWLAAASVRGHQVTRRDEARVVATTGLCVGVVRVVATSVGDRFEAVYPPCAPGQPWRPFATRYTTRAGALDRAARGGPTCPSTAPPASRLPTPLPFSPASRSTP